MAACGHPQRCAGLSPRVRGNLLALLAQEGRPGSIPACAGEPRAADACARRPSVYPRVCGGTTQSPAQSISRRGLSPRVRGNRFHQFNFNLFNRSIPACAGEPGQSPFGVPASTVYPRVCGGTWGRSSESVLPSGLSPRVRGNRVVITYAAGAVRSIPACAGEPRMQRIASVNTTVYPRVCGGTACPRCGRPA